MSSILTTNDILSLEQYHAKRQGFRETAMQRRGQLRFNFNEHFVFSFEDRLTIHYQIQEMLRTEKLFKPQEIQSELDVYNPLISDNKNLKATLMLCYDPAQRDQALHDLVGIEDSFELLIEGSEPSPIISNEDLPRSTDEKTSAVHFVRFALNSNQHQMLMSGNTTSIRCNHAKFQAVKTIDSELIRALIAQSP